jgi:hypothetical protein
MSVRAESGGREAVCRLQPGSAAAVAADGAEAA